MPLAIKLWLDDHLPLLNARWLDEQMEDKQKHSEHSKALHEL